MRRKKRRKKYGVLTIKKDRIPLTVLCFEQREGVTPRGGKKGGIKKRERSLPIHYTRDLPLEEKEQKRGPLWIAG